MGSRGVGRSPASTASFDYDKLTQATRAILAGARFVATNADALAAGRRRPGAALARARIVAALIQTATGVEPIVVGKPDAVCSSTGWRAWAASRRARWR